MSNCKNCHAALPLEARFCLSCGTPVTREAQERKQVSILFADLSGFTSLSEKMDPEQVTDLVNDCFQSLGKIVKHYDGTIDKFMGDCIMALFGAPIAHEDDAKRSIACALDMHRELEKLNERHQLSLKLRCGINFGLVVAGGVGADGKLDYTVMGDTVNLAQRVQKAAEPGQSLVTASLFQACEHAFEFQSLPSIQAKGKSENIPVFAVLAARSEAAELRLEQRGYRPLVGREAELNKILEACRKSSPTLKKPILVEAEAGVGKTRLIFEVERRLKEKQSSFWASSFCRSSVKEPAYASFSRILIAIESHWKLPQLGLSLELLKELEDLLKAKTELSEANALNAETRRQRIGFAIREIFRKTIYLEPSTLCFEDIHWMDQGSLSLLSEICGEISETECQILITTRPGIELKSLREISEIIHLRSLSNEASLQLIIGTLSGGTPNTEFVELIQERADGNPLFIEELIKSLIDSEQAKLINQRWQLVEFQAEEIPPNLHSLIASRIDQLGLDEKSVLQFASVIGRSFEIGLLEQILSPSIKLRPALLKLISRELIFKTSENSQKETYFFKHALIQEVAYESLLIKTRRQLHGQIAEIFEKDLRLANGQFEILAHHYARAERSERAIDYLQLSGIRAAAQFDNEKAIGYFQEVIRALEERYSQNQVFDARILDINNKLEEIYRRLSKYAEAEELMHRQVFLAETQEFPMIQSQALRRLGEISRNRDNLPLALDWFQKSLTVAEKNEDLQNQSKTSKAIATCFRAQKKLKESLDRYRWSHALAIQAKDFRLQAELLNDIATVQIDLEDIESAESYLKQAQSLCVQIDGTEELQISVEGNLGVVEYKRNNFLSSLKRFKKGAELAKKYSYVQFEATCLNNAAQVCLKLEDVAGAERLLIECLNESEKISLWPKFLESSKALSDIYFKQKETERAYETLRKCKIRLTPFKNAELLSDCENAITDLQRKSRIKQKA